MLYIIGGIILGFILIIMGIFYKFKRDINAPDEQFVADFIEENKNKLSFSLYATYNDRVLWDINCNQLLPLASTVKTIIAIEYAYQVASKQIDPLEVVSIENLERHYIAHLDGGAHEAWLKTVSPTNITLNDVAKGMIAFSSNANTDYLLTKLGIDKVNERLKALKLLDHTPIYPLVSTLYVPLYLNEKEKLQVKDIPTFIKTMSMNDYINYVLLIHNRLIERPFSNEEKVKAAKMLKLDVQKAISDKQSSSTTASYTQLMKMLNRKDVFPSAVYRSLDPIMEQALEQEKYRTQYRHFGGKGGSTAFMLTDTVYATDLKGNMFELAFFANNLSLFEQRKLSRNLRPYYERYFNKLMTSQTLTDSE